MMFKLAESVVITLMFIMLTYTINDLYVKVRTLKNENRNLECMVNELSDQIGAYYQSDDNLKSSLFQDVHFNYAPAEMDIITKLLQEHIKETKDGLVSIRESLNYLKISTLLSK